MASARLLYLASSFPYGTNDVFFGPEARELVRQGVELCVVPIRPRGGLTTEDVGELAVRRPLLDARIAIAALQELLRSPGRVVGAVALLLRSPAPPILLRNLAAFPKALWVARLARTWPADHIHAHWAGPPSTVALVASRVSGVPWSFTAHFADIAANNLLREKSDSAHVVRFIAEAMMDLARRTAPGVDESRWALLHLGVELVPVSSRSVDLNDPPVVAMVARFDLEKRHQTLLRAVRKIRDSGSAIEVWLAGTGPLEEATKQLARDLGIESVVRFFGFVPNLEVLEWLAGGQVDLVALPSDAEGLPVTLIEALAHGVPAVAADAGGVSELLGQGCGEIVAPGDAEALADAIMRLLRNPELRAERARAGRARIEREFAVAPIVQRLLELLALSGGHVPDDPEQPRNQVAATQETGCSSG